MNKELQRCINSWCLDAMARANDDIGENGLSRNGDRLRYCRAFVYETSNYYILQSYNSFGVAIIDKNTKQCYDLLRYVYGYTSTSAQHISKFWHDYGDTKIPRYTYRII